MVFDDSRDMLQVARDAMEFFAHESCGKCFPCRIGTRRLTERLAGEAGPRREMIVNLQAAYDAVQAALKSGRPAVIDAVIDGAAEVLAEPAATDPLYRKVYEAYTGFLSQVRPYTGMSELAYVQARDL